MMEIGVNRWQKGAEPLTDSCRL